MAELKFENELKLMDGIDKRWVTILSARNGSIMLSKIRPILETIPPLKLRPHPSEIFNFARYTPVDKVRYVIIGQDPYYAERHAHGLAFSTSQTNIPKSLGTIFKVMCAATGSTYPKIGDLTGWAAQGVLLLNSALTTVEGQDSAHLHIWKPYVEQLIKNIVDSYKELTFILWGKKAQAFMPLLGSHKVLTWAHPAARAGQFLSCPHFKEIKLQWDPAAPIYVEAFTDGSATPNKIPRVPEDIIPIGGYGIVFTRGAYAGQKYQGCITRHEPPYATNIRAEGMAILATLQMADQLPSEQVQLIRIITDSEFWMNMIYKYVPSWTPEELETKKNVDLIKKIMPLIKKHWVILEYVPSHDKADWSKYNVQSDYYRRYMWNKEADRLAKNGALLGKPQIIPA
jgi:uracil-DNA glycosylase